MPIAEHHACLSAPHSRRDGIALLLISKLATTFDGVCMDSAPNKGAQHLGTMLLFHVSLRCSLLPLLPVWVRVSPSTGAG